MRKLGYFGAAFAGAMMFASAGNAVTVDALSMGPLEVGTNLTGITVISDDAADTILFETGSPISLIFEASIGNAAGTGLSFAASGNISLALVNPAGGDPVPVLTSELVQVNGDGSISLFATFATIVADTIADGATLLGRHYALTIMHGVPTGGCPTGGQGACDYSVNLTAAVPVPAALPLFGTGLGILGFLGWRRRRKQNAQVAA